jgi:hypothetical protein
VGHAGHEGGEALAQTLMLIGIEMDAVDRARRRDRACVEEVTAEIRRGRLVGRGKARRFRGGADELGRDRAARISIGGGATMRMGGTGMPGSMGACRMAPTRVAIPCAAC